jgi:hypothetical protein
MVRLSSLVMSRRRAPSFSAQAPWPRSATAQGVVHDASHRVLDGDIRRRHHIARAFRGDVLRADATPSQLERSVDRAHGDHGFATEPFSERRHRCLEVLSREIEAAHAKILPRTISEGQSGTLSRMVDN